jgi:hypothetical protein
MIPLARRSAAAVLVWVGFACDPSAHAEDPVTTTLPARPISSSIERVVERMEQQRKQPCAQAWAEGVPCFPVSTDLYGPVFSVRDSLRDLGAKDGASPNRPPTIREMSPFRPGSQTPSVPMASFDPGCVAKSALKALKGRNDVYYLYRVRDAQGERIVLHDYRLAPASIQGDFELLGKFEGECEALAAYRRDARLSKAKVHSPP